MPRGTASLRTPNTESTAVLNLGLPWKCDTSARRPYVIWSRCVRRYVSPSDAEKPRASPWRRRGCRRRVKLAGAPFSKSASVLYLKVPSRFVVLSCAYWLSRASVASLNRCLLSRLIQDSWFWIWALVLFVHRGRLELPPIE